MDYANSALLQDEVLSELIMVFDYNWPAGPGFLYALGTLIEAEIIHEEVYYDPSNHTLQEDLAADDLARIISGSNFVRQLVSQGALRLLPLDDDIRSRLSEPGSQYTWDDFVEDSNFTQSRLTSTTPVGISRLVARHYRQMTDLLDMPDIFEKRQSIGASELRELVWYGDRRLGELDPTWSEAIRRYGLSANDIVNVEVGNRKTAAYFGIANTLDMNLYPSLFSLPYQVGAIKGYNSKASELYKSVAEQVIERSGDSPGADEFRRVPIPPLTQIVLEGCGGSKNAVADEVLALRERQTSFRQSLTWFQRSWNDAETREERIRLQKEFDDAFRTFTERISRPSLPRFTRILHTAWRYVRDPKKLLVTSGDDLMKKYLEELLIHKFRGLHDFWDELAASPVPEHNGELVRSMFPEQLEDDVWEYAARTSSKFNSYLFKG